MVENQGNCKGILPFGGDTEKEETSVYFFFLPAIPQ
jgi:hypothetical protein